MKVDELARLLHEAYRNLSKTSPSDKLSWGESWDELDEWKRERRRELARYILSRCKVVREHP